MATQTIETVSEEQAAEQVGVQRHRFTLSEYQALYDAGVIGIEPRLELIEGDIIDMSPINPPHSAHVTRLSSLFHRRIGDEAIILVQAPLNIDEHSQPEPDICLLKPRADFYARAHPGPGDVLLVVEVADTTLRTDRTIKTRLYARSGIPEMWLLNLADSILEVYRQPGLRGYRLIQHLGVGDEAVPLAFPKLALAVAEIFVRS